MPPELSLPSNVLPFRPRWWAAEQSRYPAGVSRRKADDVTIQDARACLLVTQLQGFLAALLDDTLRWHAGTSHRRSNPALSEQIEYLFPQTRLNQLARPAVDQNLDYELAKLGAVLVATEFNRRSRPISVFAALFCSDKRRALRNLKALVTILAPEIKELQIRPLDRLARSLLAEPGDVVHFRAQARTN